MDTTTFKITPAEPPDTKWTEAAPAAEPVDMPHFPIVVGADSPSRVRVREIVYRRVGSSYVEEQMLDSGLVRPREPEPKPAQGMRFNSGKLLMSLVPASFGRYCAAGLTYGAVKYAPHNWRKGFDWSQVLDSLQRHIDAFREGEDLDEESGLPHLALAACNLAFLIEFFDKGKGNDDRFYYDGQPRGTRLDGRVLEFRPPPVQPGAAPGTGAGGDDDRDPGRGAG